MHRQPLLSALDRYRHRHPEELDCVSRFEKFVFSHPNCFERSLSIGHVTASVWIVDAAGEKTLLTHHRKLNLWLQPGGHADGNPDVLAVANQEAIEETGLTTLEAVSAEIFDVDIHGIPARPNEPAHDHFDVRFLLQQSGDEPYVVSEESHDLAWVPMVSLEDYTDEWSMRRMRDKALRRMELH